MTMPTWVREYLRTQYGCFYFALPIVKHPERLPSVAIVDFMQYLKAVPDGITTLGELINFFVTKVRSHFLSSGMVTINGCSRTRIHTVVICADKASPMLKQLICHTRRYKNKDSMFSTEGGPYLPTRSQDLLPTPFQKFTANSTLIRRELLPRLFNVFMDPAQMRLRPGQTLILNGFPGRIETVRGYSAMPWASAGMSSGEIKQGIALWLNSELPLTQAHDNHDPDLYNRTFLIENVLPSPEYPQGMWRREEIPEMKTSIAEADLSIVFFEHWFQNENVLFSINDGDAFSILLLYACERIMANNQFRNCHWLMLPNKSKKMDAFFENVGIDRSKRRFEYIDINELYVGVREDPLFKNVQHSHLTLVFMIIMAGTDFFDFFLKGIGEERTVWPVFKASIERFTHIVQMPKGMSGNTRVPRPIYVDEDAYRQFIRYCYLQHYGKTMRKKKAKRQKIDFKDTKITVKELKARTQVDSKGNPKDTAYHLPDRNEIRRMCRRTEYNLKYWKWGVHGAHFAPDIFETFQGHPYYGFEIGEDGEPKESTYVQARQKPVPEQFLQHQYRANKRKRAHDIDIEETLQKQNAVLNEFSVF